MERKRRAARRRCDVGADDGWKEMNERDKERTSGETEGRGLCNEERRK